MLRALLGLLLCLTGAAMGQTDARPAFEVASIKPSAPDARGMYIRLVPGGGLNVTNMTLKELITIAYHIQPFQISGGPTLGVRHRSGRSLGFLFCARFLSVYIHSVSGGHP